MPSGGHNRLEAGALKRRGTFRKDRHELKIVKPRARKSPKQAETHEIATSWPPPHLSAVQLSEIRAGDGDKYADFIQTYCQITKDSIAGKAGAPFLLRNWQRQLLDHLLARSNGRLRHRQALIGVARKNGKSAWGAAVALAGLWLGPKGGEVYSCAAEKEQARIVFGTARRMVELEPRLGAKLKLFRDAIEYTETGSVYRVLSAEAYSKEGLNPHLVIFDEVHAQPNRELWDVMSLAMGARDEPLLVGITTAGVRTDAMGRDSLCYGLYQYGCQVANGEVIDPSFLMAWWEPRNPEADHRSEATWREANPGFGDVNSLEHFKNSILTTPESEFRTKHCNQWVATSTAWLPWGAWDACSGRQSIPDGAEVILGFDGSYNNDTTALIVVAPGPKPYVDVVACWERPATADNSWKVPIEAVEEAIRVACKRWQVREIACDEFRWARSLSLLEREGLPMVKYPQNAERMVPATQRFYEAVLNKQLTHSGDARLARHIENCTLEISQRGARISKESKNSGRKIDLAVAAVMAFDRACQAPAAFAGVAFG